MCDLNLQGCAFEPVSLSASQFFSRSVSQMVRLVCVRQFVSQLGVKVVVNELTGVCARRVWASCVCACLCLCLLGRSWAERSGLWDAFGVD